MPGREYDLSGHLIAHHQYTSLFFGSSSGKIQQGIQISPG
jgi:hypothetical protein